MRFYSEFHGQEGISMDIATLRSRILCAVGVSVEIAPRLWTYAKQNPGETEADVRPRV